MGAWLTELRRNLPHDIVLHVVGTKSDVVAREPSKREVPFERCIVSSFRAYTVQITGQAMRRRLSAPPFFAEGLPRVVLTADLGKYRLMSPRISPRA